MGTKNLLLIEQEVKVSDAEPYRIGVKLILKNIDKKVIVFIAQAAWLRCLNGTAFASLLRYGFAIVAIPPSAEPNRKTQILRGYETTGNSMIL